MTKQLIFASRNAGKIKEIRSLLKPLGVEVLSAIEADLPEVEETGETFAENASLKASSAALSAGLPALADDSGLCIHALKNAPGVLTARYAQKCGGYEAAFADIFKKLEGKSDWTAHFSCVIALAFPNGTIKTYEGKCEGRIVQPKGIDGFGFDPIFEPKGYTQTFAELPEEVKNQISHRGCAMRAFLAGFENLIEM